MAAATFFVAQLAVARVIPVTTIRVRFGIWIMLILFLLRFLRLISSDGIL
jgi:hypothetical protein